MKNLGFLGFVFVGKVMDGLFHRKLCNPEPPHNCGPRSALPSRSADRMSVTTTPIQKASPRGSSIGQTFRTDSTATTTVSISAAASFSGSTKSTAIGESVCCPLPACTYANLCLPSGPRVMCWQPLATAVRNGSSRDHQGKESACLRTKSSAVASILPQALLDLVDGEPGQSNPFPRICVTAFVEQRERTVGQHRRTGVGRPPRL